MVVHRCLSCGLERHNRIAADDDFDRVLGLPEASPWTQAADRWTVADWQPSRPGAVA